MPGVVLAAVVVLLLHNACYTQPTLVFPANKNNSHPAKTTAQIYA